MGFQVTPYCANMPSGPKRTTSTAGQSKDLSCASATVNQPNNSPFHEIISESKHELVPDAEYDQSVLLQAAARSAKSTHDFCTSSSLSLRCHDSSKFLLSACSSLASIPSLGLSLNAGESKAHELLSGGAAIDGGISALCTCTATLRGLGDQVVCDASANDGFFYSASSGSPTISLFSQGVGAILNSSGAGFGFKTEGFVRAIAVVGDQLFSSHSDLKIRVWARPGSLHGAKLTCTGGDAGRVSAQHQLVATLPTRWDCLARAVTLGGYRQVRRHHCKLWIEHADAISAMAVDAKQGYLYSGSWDRTVKVWRLRDFKCVESFRAHDDAINTLVLSANGRFLYTAAADGKIKVWTWADGSIGRRSRPAHCLVTTLQAHRSAINALALSAEGELLYSGACDKAIVVWEREESSAHHASLSGALRGHRQAVLCLASWGNTLCSGSADKSIRVWQRLAGRLHVCLAVLQGHSAPIKSLILSPSQEPRPDATCFALCSAALDHVIKVWHINVS